MGPENSKKSTTSESRSQRARHVDEICGSQFGAAPIAGMHYIILRAPMELTPAESEKLVQQVKSEFPVDQEIPLYKIQDFPPIKLKP